MSAFRRLPVLGLLLPFAGGSCLGARGHLCIELIPALYLLVFILILQWVIRRKRKGLGKPALLQDVLYLGIFFLSGLAGSQASRPRDPGLSRFSSVMVLGEVRTAARYSFERWYFDLEVRQLWTGDSMLHMPTTLRVRLDSFPGGSIPGPGQTLMLSGRPVAISGPCNPGEVNYARILQQRNCWYRLYTNSGDVRILQESGGRSAKLQSAAIRKGIYDHWEGPPEVIGLLKSICLGDRSTMDRNLREDYARAGGMHLLAVSGLHVGVIWWILHRLLHLLVRISGREAARCIVILSLLWCYAWLTGFSPSVSRSVSMFSLFSLSGLLDRRGPPLNILFLSMFLLLLVRPCWILETGFQLSYVAVGAILLMHPLIQRAIKVRNPILRWFRDMLSLSLAAQLGTLPLVAAFFARIPLYGILTSLLTLPMLSMLLATFVLSLPFMGLESAADFFARLLVFGGSWMNRIIHWVSSLPLSVWGPVTLDGISLPLSLLFIFLLPGLGRKRWRRFLLPALLILSLLMLRSASLQWDFLGREQVVVAHLRDCTCISIRRGQFLDHYLWLEEEMPGMQVEQYLERAWPRRTCRHHIIRVEAGTAARGSISTALPLTEGLYLCGNASARILVLREGLGEAAASHLSGNPPDLLVLSGAPPLGSLSVAGSATSGIPLVADASNPAWYLKEVVVPSRRIHVTGDKGAFILNR